jgi:hypothetical protein
MHKKLDEVCELDPGHASNQIGQPQKNYHDSSVCEISQHLCAKFREIIVTQFRINFVFRKIK